MLQRIRAWLSGRKIFVRTLSIAMLLVSIPLMGFSLFTTSRAQRDIQRATEQQLLSAADLTAAHFSATVDQFTSATQFFSSTPQLQSFFLGKSVWDDREAIRTLRTYKSALPYVSLCGFFDTDKTDTVYTSGGKYDLRILLEYVLHIDAASFFGSMNQKTLYFLPWNRDIGGMLCTVSLSPDTAQVRRSCLFLCSSNDMISSFAAILGGTGYRLGAIYDTHGEIVFYNVASPFSLSDLQNTLPESGTITADGYICRRSSSGHGYSAAIYTAESTYLSAVRAFESSTRITILVIILVSVITVITLTWINYQPVNSLMTQMNLPVSQETENEFERIRSAYSSHERKLSALEIENEENRSIILGHLLEKLLDGQAVEGPEAQILRAGFPDGECCFVAVTQLKPGVHPLSVISALSESPDIIPFETRRDNFFAFICRIPAPKGQAAALQRLQELIGLDLGAGSVGIGWKAVHASYLEALLAFDQRNGSSVLLYESLKAGNVPANRDPSVGLMQLARTLKNGDSAAITYLERLFDDIERGNAPLFVKRYECYHLIDSLQGILEKMEIPMDSERAARIISHDTPEAIRKACREALELALQAIRKKSEAERTAVTGRILELIEEKYTDPDLSLIDLAELLDMTEYSASRTFKEYVGSSFRKYVTSRRIELAKELLGTTEMSIQEIASQSGFASPSYFIRVFKAETGSTPSDFRGQKQES